MNELTTTTTTNQIEIMTDEKLNKYVKTFLTNQLNPSEVSQFIEIAKAYNLNPFKREIYCISYGKGQDRKLSILTGYEIYIKRAERTGLLTGWKAWTDGNIKDKTLKACIEIYRKGWEKPFYHEVDFSEYNQNNRIWNEKPKTMIKKVVISQGFRLAFSDEVGGMPYTADEMPEGEAIKEVSPQTTENQVYNILSQPTNNSIKDDMLYLEIEKFNQLYLDKILLTGEELELIEKTKNFLNTADIEKKKKCFNWLCKTNVELETMIKVARENVDFRL